MLERSERAQAQVTNAKLILSVYLEAFIERLRADSSIPREWLFSLPEDFDQLSNAPIQLNQHLLSRLRKPQETGLLKLTDTQCDALIALIETSQEQLEQGSLDLLNDKDVLISILEQIPKHGKYKN